MAISPRPETEINAQQPGAATGQGYSTLRRMMAEYHSPKFPVVATEVGYPTGQDVTLQDQADLSVRQCLVDEMCHVPLTTLYNWDSRQASGFAIRGRPACQALKAMTAQLAGFHYVRRLAVGTKLDYIIEFKNSSGARRIIAWTVPKNRNASQSKALPNLVAIPVGVDAKRVTLRTLYGNEAQARMESGKVVLRLTAAPTYIDMAGH